MLWSLLPLHHCDKNLCCSSSSASPCCAMLKLIENPISTEKWKAERDALAWYLFPLAAAKVSPVDKCPWTKVDPPSVCNGSSLCRRVGRWVRRTDYKGGGTERKSGVKGILSIMTGIFRSYSYGCWASNFPRTFYQLHPLHFDEWLLACLVVLTVDVWGKRGSL